MVTLMSPGASKPATERRFKTSQFVIVVWPWGYRPLPAYSFEESSEDSGFVRFASLDAWPLPWGNSA
jgi:hypothetical protein